MIMETLFEACYEEEELIFDLEDTQWSVWRMVRDFAIRLSRVFSLALDKNRKG
jgi:hypothetical protein